MKLKKYFLIGAALFGAATSANAVTLSGIATADNAFSIYWSTSASSLGTLITSGNNWQTAYPVPASGTTTLSGAGAGDPYFINVVLTNFTPTNGYPQYPYSPTSNPSAFLGDFSLGGSGYQFLNGSTAISTNDVDWLVSTTSDPSTWVPPSTLATSYGTNLSNPIWYPDNGNNPISGISNGAEWIYGSDQSDALYADLSTEIIPLKMSETPLPSTWSMLLAGLIGLGVVSYRRRNKNCHSGALA